VKKIKSGEGATDFGQSSGLTQEELLGRPKAEDFFETWTCPAGDRPEYEIIGVPFLSQERIAELIHIELVKDEVSQGKIKSIGFMPSWILQAAEAIVTEYS
jgi:hypothetical protein